MWTLCMTENSQWYFRKEINIGHLVTTMSVIFSLIWFMSNMNNQIVLLHREDQILHDRINDVRDQTKEGMAEIKEMIKEIDATQQKTLGRIERKIDGKADK